MSEMVERVARAIHEASKEPPDRHLAEVLYNRLTNQSQDRWRERARAAIVAMREPTERMKTAFILAECNKGPGRRATDCYNAAIDEALRD